MRVPAIIRPALPQACRFRRTLNRRLIGAGNHVPVLVTLRRLLGMNVVALDGTMGALRDLRFDTSSGHVRYLVVDHDEAPAQVIVPAACLGALDVRSARVHVQLTRAQVVDFTEVTAEHWREGAARTDLASRMLDSTDVAIDGEEWTIV